MTEFYREGGWLVTDTILRTPKKSFDVSRIESVAVRRNVFHLAAAPGVGMFLLALAFWPYLYGGERLFLTLGPVVCLVLAWNVGTIRVDSLALRDDEGGVIYGRHSRLMAVREAVEQAIEARRTLAREQVA